MLLVVVCSCLLLCVACCWCMLCRLLLIVARCCLLFAVTCQLLDATRYLSCVGGGRWLLFVDCC